MSGFGLNILSPRLTICPDRPHSCSYTLTWSSRLFGYMQALRDGKNNSIWTLSSTRDQGTAEKGKRPVEIPSKGSLPEGPFFLLSCKIEIDNCLVVQQVIEPTSYDQGSCPWKRHTHEYGEEDREPLLQSGKLGTVAPDFLSKIPLLKEICRPARRLGRIFLAGGQQFSI